MHIFSRLILTGLSISLLQLSLLFRSFVYSVARDCDNGKVDRKVLLEDPTLLVPPFQNKLISSNWDSNYYGGEKTKVALINMKVVLVSW